MLLFIGSRIRSVEASSDVFYLQLTLYQHGCLSELEEHHFDGQGCVLDLLGA